MKKKFLFKIDTSNKALLLGIASTLAIGIISIAFIVIVFFISIVTEIPFFFLPYRFLSHYISDDAFLSYLFPIPFLYFVIFLPLFMTYLFSKKFDKDQETPRQKTFLLTILISIIVFFFGYVCLIE